MNANAKHLRTVAALAAGVLFGLGLIVSGMSNPAKIQNFLDLAGTWDPSLAFVMAAAVSVTFVGYRLLGAPTATALRREILLAHGKGHRRAAPHRRRHLRSRLGPLRLLPRPRAHRAAPARRRHARLRARHVHRHVGGEGSPSPDGKGRRFHAVTTAFRRRCLQAPKIL